MAIIYTSRNLPGSYGGDYTNGGWGSLMNTYAVRFTPGLGGQGGGAFEGKKQGIESDSTGRWPTLGFLYSGPRPFVFCGVVVCMGRSFGGRGGLWAPTGPQRVHFKAFHRVDLPNQSTVDRGKQAGRRLALARSATLD